LFPFGKEVVMSFYMKLNFKVKDLELFKQVLEKRGFEVRHETYQSNHYLSLYSSETSFTLAVDQDGDVNLEGYLSPEKIEELQEELEACNQQYILEQVRRIAAEAGMAITECVQSDDRTEILLEEF